MILNNAGIVKSYNIKKDTIDEEGVLFIKNDESIYAYITLYDALLFFKNRKKIKRIRLNKIKATDEQMKDLIKFFALRGYEVITEEENYIDI